jgi:hypothetical protein
LFVIACINGGQGGGKGSTASNAGTGGEHGGWVGLEIAYSALAASYVMTIGASGAGASATATGANQRGTAGGVTSFGSLVTGIAGVGYLKRASGIYVPVPELAPGRGGDGGALVTNQTTLNWLVNGLDGGRNAYVAPGLAGGGSLVPTAGNPAPTGTPAGGSGGGGGGATSTTVPPGAAGGAPGGGGGGGACSNSTWGNGGAGAAGAIYVIAPY